MALSAPAVSVIIPAYNAGKYIRETLASVLAQTMPEIEVIVVDDCSKDDTAAIVNEMMNADPRLRYERMPQNAGGPAAPRNRGVSVAHAPWVAFCDSDDIWAPHKLATQYPIAQTSEACLISTAIMDFHDGDPIPQVRPPERVALSLIGPRKMAIKNWIAMSSVMCRRDLIAAAGFFEESRDFVAVEDYDLWLRMMDLTGLPAVRIDATLVCYRRVPTSISASKTMMVKKAMRVLSRFYARRGAPRLLYVFGVFHVAAYVTTSFWMRYVKGKL